VPRIPEIDPDQTSGYVAAMLKAQADTFGRPLNNHLLYAHRPDFFKAARGMWTALDADGILGTGLVSLVNRRVASLNGCVF
jgi:alkylhydroperoxidase family enzyme